MLWYSVFFTVRDSVCRRSPKKILQKNYVTLLTCKCNAFYDHDCAVNLAIYSTSSQRIIFFFRQLNIMISTQFLFIFLFLSCFPIKLSTSQSTWEIYLDKIRSSYSSDVAQEECKNIDTCFDTIKKIQSIKLVDYYSKTLTLNDEIAKISGNKNWARNMEGIIFY